MTMDFQNALGAMVTVLLSVAPQQSVSQNSSPENVSLLECSISRVCNQEQCIHANGRGRISLLYFDGYLIEERKEHFVKLGFLDRKSVV